MKNTKLYILTGFLGSGKTTVLLELCRQLKDSRVGVIQNELGKINIDGTILRNDDVRMVEISRGSIFCTCLMQNFIDTLAEMSKENFDYLFVESSGWGDPSNVHELIEEAKQISGIEYDFGGVICFVDALNFPEQVRDLETAQRQLKHCNLAVITKVDLADDSAVEHVRELIREINPVCEILTSAMADMDYSFLRKDITIYQWSEDEASTNSSKNKPKTLFLEYQGEADGEELKRFLRELAPLVFRVKGFCLLKDSGWTQVDLVGDMIDYKPCDPFSASQLVLISKVGPQIIRPAIAAWEANVSTPMRLKN